MPQEPPIPDQTMTRAAPTAGQRPGQPALAVLVPVFNAQQDLEQSLSSLAADDARFEVFVVDDGSEPPVAVPENVPFPIRLHRLSPNGGITKALNAGLEQIAAAGFPYVARLDAGDLSLPGRFTEQLAYLEAHRDHALLGTFAEIVDERGQHLYEFRRPTSHAGLVRELCYRNGFCHPSVMMRMSALLDVGFYRDAYPGGEDYELWLRLARRYKVANLARVFVVKEEGGSSISARRLRLGLSRLRLQGHHLNPLSVHSYLGIARSIVMLCISRDMMLRLLRLRARFYPVVRRFLPGSR